VTTVSPNKHTRETVSPSQNRRVFTVGEITKDIKKLLETGFDSVWVKGEISTFRRPGSGHFYFTLKDENAIINCVMFRFRNQKLKFDVEEGLEVICGGRITLYEPRGNYQLLIDVMEPVGLGALQLRFEQLKEKLAGEGLFDPKNKKPLPELPQKIALITSPTGAAIQDMLNIIDRRFGNVEILVVPVSVQGERAAPEIAKALATVNQLAEHDVIILGRGGGSIEDLWAFNEEIVARSIFESKIPVVSAVGHEIDFTIADFVADLRAPTPSAAAELVVKNKVDLQKNILNILERLRQAYVNRLHLKRNRMLALSGRIVNPKRKLEDWRLRLSDLQERLQYTLLQNIREARTQFKQILPNLTSAIRLGLERHHKKLDHIEAVLKTLNPLAILERGYSIAHSQGNKIIRAASQTKKGDEISIRLFEGTLICEVKKINA